jgi:hypothetical protein
MKKSFKNPKISSSCHESNCVKKFQIFVHLVYFGALEVHQKRKKKKKSAG